MELVPRLRRRRRGGRRLAEVAACLLVAWLVLVAVVPAVLGLGQSVVNAPARGLPAGSVALTREVPLGDLEVDDLVLVADGVRRVVSVSQGEVTLDDRVVLEPSRTATVRHAVVTAPYAAPVATVVALGLLAIAIGAWNGARRSPVGAPSERPRQVATGAA